MIECLMVGLLAGIWTFLAFINGHVSRIEEILESLAQRKVG